MFAARPTLFTSSTVAVVAANPPQQVILVADVGVDDAAGVLPVLALSRRDELEVLGIAATFGCRGNQHAQCGAPPFAAANRSSVRPSTVARRFRSAAPT